jgi:hypothetical protein
MVRRIDLKSLLIGSLLVVAVVCAMGGAPQMDGEHNGRFSMVGYDTAYGGAAIYILDTATGQLWAQGATDPTLFYAPKLEPYAPVEVPAEPNWP